MPPVRKTCSNCPSFLAGAQQSDIIGSGISGPICGTKMLPIIKPQQPQATQAKVFEAIASTCNDHGRNVNFQPLAPNSVAHLTAVGMDAVVHVADADQSSAHCSGCANYVAPGIVQARFGWTAGICRASGILLPSGHGLDGYSSDCGTYAGRTTPTTFLSNPLETFVLFSHYLDNFGAFDPAVAYRRSMENMVDPKDYKTDMPVSPEDAEERGIRAWRRVPDPDGRSEDIFLPIFDEKFFADYPDELALIPQTGSDPHPELYADHGGLLYAMAVALMVLDETPAWWGQGGVGKTEFARYLAWLMQLPFHRINLHGASEVDDILGKLLFENGETVFHPGRLPKAWQRPGFILFDEPNTAPDEIWQIVRPLTDDSRKMYMDQYKAAGIDRHTDCYFAMAMNPPWDVRNRGAQTIGDADSSRLMHFFFDYPPRDLEIEIIQQRTKLDGWTVPDDMMKSLMDACEELRGKSGMHTTWGVRHQIKVARALRWFGPVKAYKFAAGNALEPSQLTDLLTTVKSHFPEAAQV